MRCPKCSSNQSKVVDSRQSEDGRAIRRRRECEECGARFTTFERLEKTPLLVIKRDGTRQEFKREKVLNGIIRSAEKRPVSVETMEKIVDEVENKIQSLGKNEVASEKIGEFVMEEMYDLDEIAYIRFASVYREFKDTSVFLKELEEYMKKSKEGKENE